MENVLIAPSVLAADFANLQKESEMLNESRADWFHIDIMDGMFVPNLSFGLPVCEAINRHARKPLDVHLMIEQPDRYLEAFRKAGAEILTVHYEACPHLHRSLQFIRSLGAKAGVALNPHTPVDVLADILGEIDLVCLMSVNPGFGGQKFIERTYEKTTRLKVMREAAGADFLIEIDGGVNGETGPKLAAAGADVLVAGSYVFGAKNPKAVISDLKDIKKGGESRLF